MTLKDYLSKNGIYYRDFAEEVGVSIYAVRKWLNGERTPRDKTKALIAKVTKGAVQAQDWINSLR